MKKCLLVIAFHIQMRLRVFHVRQNFLFGAKVYQSLTIQSMPPTCKVLRFGERKKNHSTSILELLTFSWMDFCWKEEGRKTTIARHSDEWASKISWRLLVSLLACVCLVIIVSIILGYYYSNRWTTRLPTNQVTHFKNLIQIHWRVGFYGEDEKMLLACHRYQQNILQWRNERAVREIQKVDRSSLRKFQ